MKEDLRIKKGQETRNRILSATAEILAKDGMTGLSAKKIADQGGLSKGLLFHHFSSIDDVLSSLFDMLLKDISDNTPSTDVVTLEGFFKQLGDATIYMAIKHETEFCALFQYYNYAMTNEVYKKRITDLKIAMNQMYTQIISTIETVSLERLHNIVDNIVVTLDALGMHYTLDHDQAKFKRMWSVQSELFIGYLRG